MHVDVVKSATKSDNARKQAKKVLHHEMYGKVSNVCFN